MGRAAKLTSLVHGGITGVNPAAIAHPANPDQPYAEPGAQSCAPYSPAGHGDCCAVNPASVRARIAKPDPSLGGGWAWVGEGGAPLAAVQCLNGPTGTLGQ
eukprot:TRINITY_DN66816_c0_g1_i1.p2 TRINITY_DN66816_c0_g1~~TRINITY_DN66816_c0_g1_i1.p2  ORF type:complete len:101 (+),score=11.52 TRINITY_DN66816_c0_g1_i1:78-380(+)